MHRTVIAVIGAAVLSAAVVAAQDKSGPAASGSNSGAEKIEKNATVTYVGCLEPGSAANSFTLVHPKVKGKDAKGVDAAMFKVVPSTEKVKLESHLLQEVEVTGTVESAAPATPDAPPTFTATNVKWRADYCG